MWILLSRIVFMETQRDLIPVTRSRSRRRAESEERARLVADRCVVAAVVAPLEGVLRVAAGGTTDTPDLSSDAPHTRDLTRDEVRLVATPLRSSAIDASGRTTRSASVSRRHTARDGLWQVLCGYEASIDRRTCENEQAAQRADVKPHPFVGNNSVADYFSARHRRRACREVGI